MTRLRRYARELERILRFEWDVWGEIKRLYREGVDG